MSYEVATAISVVSIVGVMVFYFNSLQDREDHNFLKLIFFMLSFPILSGIAYYAKVLAVDNNASATQVSVLTTFYHFTMMLLIVMYAYLGIRTILWMLSKFKPGDKEPWEAKDELI